MKSTRQRILDTLQLQRMATVAELSRALQVTAADVRHHLATLQKESLVEAAGERQQLGRGRPARLFQLSHKVLDNNLGLLAGILLDTIFEGDSQENRLSSLKEIAKRLQGVSPTHGNLSQRLYQAVNRLNELNYHAHWEAHADAPRMVFGLCPYAAILAEHPELCQMDVYLLERLAGVPVRQTAKLKPDSRGVPYCRFIIGREQSTD